MAESPGTFPKNVPLLYAGDDWAIGFTVKPNGTAANLTGWSYMAAFREHEGDDGTLLAVCSVDDSAKASGTLIFSLTGEQTAGISAQLGYRTTWIAFDFKTLDTSGQVVTWIADKAQIRGRVAIL